MLIRSGKKKGKSWSSVGLGALGFNVTMKKAGAYIGANHHVLRDRAAFTTFETITDSITGIAGSIKVCGRGDINVELGGIELKLKNYLYAPDSPADLISFTTAASSDAKFIVRDSSIIWDEFDTVIARIWIVQG